GAHGPAVVPGRAAASLLVRALRHDESAGLKMPPGAKLPDPVVADFAAWINGGAAWPAKASAADAFTVKKHWAFQPVRAVEPPADPSGWSDNPIDRFIAASRSAAGLAPA